MKFLDLSNSWLQLKRPMNGYEHEVTLQTREKSGEIRYVHLGNLNNVIAQLTITLAKNKPDLRIEVVDE